MEENVIQINGGIIINANVSWKNVMYVKKIWNPCENEKYLASIMDDSEIMCDEFIELNDKETKTIPTNLNEKKAIRKTHNSYILLGFLFIVIALLIAFRI